MAQRCKIDTLTDTRYDLGEGPHWDVKRSELFFVDAFVGKFHRVDSTGHEQTLSFDDVVTFIVPWEGEHNTFVVSKKQDICKLNWNSHSLTTLATVEEEVHGNRFNDAKCDPQGRLFAGTMGTESSPGSGFPAERGALYNFDGKTVTKQADKVTLSNGLTWSADGKLMYFVDSVKRHIYVFDYDASTGNLSNQRVLFDFNKHDDMYKQEVPDGMTMDTDGNLWVACFDGGRILRIDPRVATLLDYIELPATKITSLCFGGPHLSTLYITSATKDLTHAEHKAQPLAGSVFKVNLESVNAKGYEMVNFKPIR
jgi:sugar lactone lactonase YvrE